MLVVPAATPVTIPVVEPMVAVPVALLLHVPPVVALVSVIELPAHTPKAVDVLIIAVGTGFTVTTPVVVHAPVVV